MRTKFGIDSSSRFSLGIRTHTDRHTDTTDQYTCATDSLLLASLIYYAKGVQMGLCDAL